MSTKPPHGPAGVNVEVRRGRVTLRLAQENAEQCVRGGARAGVSLKTRRTSPAEVTPAKLTPAE